MPINQPEVYQPTVGEVITVEFDGGTGCVDQTTITFENESQCVELALKVMLQGPFNNTTGMMNSKIDVNADGSKLYVANTSGGTNNNGSISIINTSTNVVEKVDIPGQARQLIDPKGQIGRSQTGIAECQ